MTNLLIYFHRILTLKPRRYRNLFKEIRKSKCKHLIEIGTFNGDHALQMIQTAALNYKPESIIYHGFDLFESFSSEILEQELSKKPITQKQTEEKLKETGSTIVLHQGYTSETLPQFLRNQSFQPDFIFIDGGHSEETIHTDWENCKQLMNKQTIVIFDDYYVKKPKNLNGFGCNKIIEEIDQNLYEIKLLEPTDKFKKEWGYLKVNMVKVTLKNNS